MKIGGSHELHESYESKPRRWKRRGAEIGRCFIALISLAVCCELARARTIVLTDLEADQAAAIDAVLPHSGWVGYAPSGPGMFNARGTHLSSTSAFLIRFRLDRVPAGQRIVRAEVIIPVTHCGEPTDIYVWRVLADWGPGVSYQLRRLRPERAEWSVPGARGTGVDRATAPTGVVAVERGQMLHFRVDVTRDVELWYTGLAPNRGWMFDCERSSILAGSPLGNSAAWKLAVTYEPE